jgi:hypothetical protein
LREAKRAIIALSLFASLSGALQLSEYAYHLPEKNPPTSFLYAAPRPCTGFQAIELSARARQNEEFAEAVSWALKAREESKFAGVSAWFYSNVYLVDWAARSLYQRWLSEKCFSHGSRALYYSIKASKSGLKALDENVAQLEKMTDPSYEGAAGGIKAALLEASGFIEERESEGDSIGNYFEKSRARVEEAWDGFSYGAPSANSIQGAAESLVAEDSLLEKESSLNDAVKAAIASLKEEFEVYSSTAEERRESAQSALKRLEGEELSAVSSDAFLMVGGASTASTGLDFDSFADDLRRARRTYEDALIYRQSAQSFWAGEGSGYASKAINKQLEALQAFDESIQRSDASLERAVALEQRLHEKANEEKARVRSLAEAAEAHSSSLAIARLNALEQKEKKLPTLGKKINYYLRQLNELNVIEALLDGEALEEQRAALEALLNEAGEVMALAEKDDLSVEQEKAVLERVRTALPTAGASALAVLAGDAESAVENVYAAATAKYGALLEGYYAHLTALKNALPNQQTAALATASTFFEGGRLNVEERLGSLKELKESLEEVEEFVAVNTPDLLRAHLSENLEVTESVEEPVFVGATQAVRTTVSTRNLLPLSYSSLLAIPAGVTGTQTGGNAELKNEKLYLEEVKEGGEYFAVAERSAVLERVESVSRSLEFADENGALFEETHSLNSQVDAWSILLLERAYEFEVLGSPANHSAIAFNAVKGSNKVSFSVFIPEPVRVTKSYAYQGETVVATYEFENVAEHLDEYYYSEENPLNCSLTGKHEDNLRAGAEEFVDVKIKDFAFKETASLSITFECQLLEENAQNFVESAGEAGLETSEAEALLAQSDYFGAVHAVSTGATQAEPTPAEEALALAAESGEELASLLREAANAENPEKALKALSKELLCKTCGEAKALHAVGDYSGAIQSAWNEKKRVEEEEALAETKEQEKIARLDSFTELQGSARSALQEFEDSFEVDDSLKHKRSRSLQYQTALNHKNALEKKVSWLEKALADPSKRSLTSIESYYSSFESELASLNAALSDLKAEAEHEVALAETQQGEFGDSSTQARLDEAKSLLESGNAYSAYVAANELRHDLLDVELPNEQANWRLLLGVFGALLLGVLAYKYWKPEHKKARNLK